MDICEVCHVNTATIHLTQIENGHTTMRHLCADCAEEEGLPFLPENMGDLDGEEMNSQPLMCSDCGTTEEDYRKTKLLGCPKCYNVFKEDIDEEEGYTFKFRRYDGKKYGISKSNSRINQLDILRKELDSAIKEERFEVATVLRDKVRELEAEEERRWS